MKQILYVNINISSSIENFVKKIIHTCLYASKVKLVNVLCVVVVLRDDDGIASFNHSTVFACLQVKKKLFKENSEKE